MPLTRNEIWDKLRALSIVEVTVSFSGGNDEGGCDDMIAKYADGTEKPMHLKRVYEDWKTKKPVTYENGADRPATPEEIADSELGEALEQPVEERYSSFAGDFRVEGEVTWNVTDETVKIEGRESVEAYESFEEEL